MEAPSKKQAFLLTIGQACTYGCSFIRNMFLARILTKADFGLAAIFSMTIVLLELSNKMSFGVQVVQSPDGDKPQSQSNFHTAMVFSGVTSSLLILIFSKPFSTLFGAPHAWTGFVALALVPLLRSFEHLDSYRYRRNFNYSPGILVELVPQLLVTIAAWPISLILNDYRIIVCLALIRSVLSLSMTHLVATSPYRLEFNKKRLSSIFKFSWPLLLNGFVLFGAQQADQLLIGSFLKLEDLAIYYSAFTLAIVPYYIIGPVQNSLLMPILSKVQNGTNEFARIYRKSLEATVIISMLIIAPLSAVGEKFIGFFYGSKYHGSGEIISILCISTSLLVYRSVSATAALSQADAKSQLFTHLFRSLSIPIATTALLFSENLQLVALSAVLAEITANAYSIFRLKSLHKVPIKYAIRPFLFLLISASLPFATKELIPINNISHFFILIFIHLGTTIILARLFLNESYRKAYSLITQLIGSTLSKL